MFKGVWIGLEGVMREGVEGLVYDVTVRWHGVHGHILQNITRQLLTNTWRVRHDGVRSHRTRMERGYTTGR